MLECFMNRQNELNERLLRLEKRLTQGGDLPEISTLLHTRDEERGRAILYKLGCSYLTDRDARIYLDEMGSRVIKVLDGLCELGKAVFDIEYDAPFLGGLYHEIYYAKALLKASQQGTQKPGEADFSCAKNLLNGSK